MRRWTCTLTAVLLASSMAAVAASVEDIVQLPAHGGGSLPYLRGWDDQRAAVAVAVLFTGGSGAVGLLTRGIPRPGANFLVRTRALFQAQGISTAVIDTPSRLSQMTDNDRMSTAHLADVAAVVRDLQQRWPGLPVFLVGTSRGTVSAAHAGAALGPAVAGVVLSSSVYNATQGGAGLSGFALDSIRSRLLLVHHVDDRCVATPYWMASRLAAAWPLVSVHGGSAPRSGPCDPFSPHGFYGVEAPTVQAISGWMLGLGFPKTVP